ncbi:Lon protease [Desulfuromonas versatilis]|uniref:Lon protease n=1 Tax=Desulfuromonas versatilis TaxID=2802975 RepID=A0ABM8HUK3_9BACT|nr:endopeptidase La [Desulfuromonas versatilis]BCR05607.1 Lon protease [Desulfuromonas versatilis]
MIERPQLLPPTLPVYPLREQVLFPNMVFPLFVGAEGMPVIEEAMRNDHMVAVAACLSKEDPCRYEDLGRICTAARISKVFRFPDGGGKAVLEGVSRIRLVRPTQQVPFFVSVIEPLVEKDGRGLVAEALVQSVNALLKIALAYGRPLPGDVLKMIDRLEDAGRLADMVGVYLNLQLRDQQRLLEMLDPIERLKEVYMHLTDEVQKLQVRGNIQSEVARRLGKSQKEYLLREQMKEIQEELGDEDPRTAELNEMRKRIQRGGMPENVRKVADKELARLERINPASPEYTVARTYLEYLCNVPWNRGTEDSLNIGRAEQVLDEDHYNLKEVKERILEYLAVRSLKTTTKGPILCFVGPPGVGKTSLGKSIARAMGRKFIRISLGGMKDEAEIRGHRRTYIGALPGRIIQEICRVEANNPVFMLDEIDKIGQDFRGDPASALLEVLDPEQNNNFADHYLDVPFDLSRVMFITTANLIDPIPHALRDRMEIIHLAGYSDEEKKQIAFRYLIPKQVEENGLAKSPLKFEDAAVLKVVRDYTREAGVRTLERKIAAICRKVARQITQGQPARSLISSAEVEELLGPRKFFSDIAGEEDRIGVVTGLAWTEAGGDIIFVEAASMTGKKDLILTGSLGEVMQESARAALSFVRAQAEQFGLASDFLENRDLHLHVPSGAIPKDGPSAGITLATAIISLMTGRPARRDVAMTGELTLSGRILPIGGVKEKVLAARRAGVKTVLLPLRNRDNLKDLDENSRGAMQILFVESMAEVVEHTLLPARDSQARGRFRDGELPQCGVQP